MSSALTFTFALDAAEQVEVAALVAQRAKRPRVWRLVGLPLLLLPLAMAVVLDWPVRILWAYALVLVLAAALHRAVPMIQRRQTTRALRAAPELSTLRYDLGVDGVSVITGIARTQLSWDGVEEAVELPNMYVLFFRGPFAYYIPKRAIGERQSELRELLRACLGARAGTMQAGVVAQVT